MIKLLVYKIKEIIACIRQLYHVKRSFVCINLLDEHIESMTSFKTKLLTVMITAVTIKFARLLKSYSNKLSLI